MANSYYQVYIHAVFAVKYRDAVIQKGWKNDLLAVIGKLINETGSKTYIVNGVEDHVHCLFSLKSTIPLSEVMQIVKAKSSKWINESNLLKHRFEWQKGYGAFSYSKSQLETVYRYIENQEAHHQNQSFIDEYLGFLEKFEIEFDERFIFEELI